MDDCRLVWDGRATIKGTGHAFGAGAAVTPVFEPCSSTSFNALAARLKAKKLGKKKATTLREEGRLGPYVNPG